MLKDYEFVNDYKSDELQNDGVVMLKERYLVSIYNIIFIIFVIKYYSIISYLIYLRILNNFSFFIWFQSLLY